VDRSPSRIRFGVGRGPRLLDELRRTTLNVILGLLLSVQEDTQHGSEDEHSRENVRHVVLDTARYLLHSLRQSFLGAFTTTSGTVVSDPELVFTSTVSSS